MYITINKDDIMVKNVINNFPMWGGGGGDL